MSTDKDPIVNATIRLSVSAKKFRGNTADLLGLDPILQHRRADVTEARRALVARLEKRG